MTLLRQVYSSGAPWEQTFGYRRAVRLGHMICVSGTAPIDDAGNTFAPGDAYAQTRRCFEIAIQALLALGAGTHHVVRTRMYVTDITRAGEYGRAHAEFFGSHPCASTMVEVSRLISPDMLVEVELDALAP